jgi:hypothetical protein
MPGRMQRHSPATGGKLIERVVEQTQQRENGSLDLFLAVRRHVGVNTQKPGMTSARLLDAYTYVNRRFVMSGGISFSAPQGNRGTP